MKVNKWILPLALFAVVSVVLVGTVAAEDTEAAPEFAGAPDCSSYPEPLCSDSQHLACRQYVAAVGCPDDPDVLCHAELFADYWQCLGPDEIQETCADLQCLEGYVCRMVGEPGEPREPACLRIFRRV